MRVGHQADNIRHNNFIINTNIMAPHQRRCAAAIAITVVLICSHPDPIGAAFGFGRKADKSADNTEKVEELSSVTADEPPSPSSESARYDDDHHRAPSIIEAEARTARELSQAVRKLTSDLNTCNSRVDAIEEGFQQLYSTHLSSVDGLRKCKEGALTADDISNLDVQLDSVDPSLIEHAAAKEDLKQRSKRNEEIATKHRELIQHLQTQVETLITREKSWERTISELVARRDLLERREGAWGRTIGDLMGEIEVREKKEGWWEEMKAEMTERIKVLSHVAVVERFGPGPHFVSVTVQVEKGDSPTSHELIFELAPLKLMPHSIHLFLTQIAEGYWSSGSPAFVLNAEHALQACPHPCLDYDELGGANTGYPYANMKDAGLDVVSFQEYSPHYPHEKYTIGFGGSPHSGPEFFVNLLDNTFDHGTLEERKKIMGDEYDAWARAVFGGPDEVVQNEKMIEPYPCFGRLVKGFAIVDKIARGMTRASLPRDDESEDSDDALDKNILLRPVMITSATILENYSSDVDAATEGVGPAVNDEL